MDQIQNYNLYGEQSRLPDVVHCETIEARSVVHNWEFKPHRHTRLHQFFLIKSGGGTALIEDVSHPIKAGDLLNIACTTIHGFSFEPGTTGWVITVASDLIDDCLNETEGLGPSLRQSSIARATDDSSAMFVSIFNEFTGKEFARAHILRAQCMVLVGLVARAISRIKPVKERQENHLQKRFEKLLEENFLDHLPVGGYADRLAVSPTHLSRVLRQSTGQSASALIAARVIREARRNLAYSNLSVSQICYQLGYSDPAYFSRVFKRATGQSPKEFRTQLDP